MSNGRNYGSQSQTEQTRRFGRSIDFGKTSADYARHRAGFPPRFFDVLEQRGLAGPGKNALDVGTGTGTVARGLAQLGLRVTGIDVAPALLEQAREIDRTAGVQIDYRIGRAEKLDFADRSFDLVTAGQCWHWFDRANAASEIHRVLRPGGRIVIAHFDWIPLPGSLAAATESLILAFNPSWTLAGGTGIYPAWLEDLAITGFQALETFSFDLFQPYSHEAWRGRIRASAGIKASLDERSTQQFDRELAALLSRHFPQDPIEVLHRVWAVTGVRN